MGGMKQLSVLRTQLEDPTLDAEGLLLLRCRLSRRLVLNSDFEGAREALGEFWPEGGRRPSAAGLSAHAEAELLLRVGVLTGWLGSVEQRVQTQERAKDLIAESLSLFEALGETAKAAEAQTELGFCYWREGALDEARVLTREALGRLGEGEAELRGWALVRAALVERTAFRLNDALMLLNEAAPLYASSEDHPLLGRFHQTFGNTLQFLGVAERRDDLIDRALLEYTAAGFHFELAGDTPNRARTENNVGYLLQRLGRFAEAHEHFDRAAALFASLGDGASVAQVDDSRAQCLLAEGRYAEAERLSRRAVAALGRGDEQSWLAEALNTLGCAVARLGRDAEARATLERAALVGERAGDVEAAGRARLALIEELGERLDPRTLRELYVAADEGLRKTQYAEVVARLRRAARRVFEIQGEAAAPPAAREVDAKGGREGAAGAAALIAAATARESHAGGAGVVFAPEAVAALDASLEAAGGEAEALRRSVERTLEAADGEVFVGAEAVAVVLLRQKNSGEGGYDFARPWDGFSLKAETRRFERPFVELALRASAGKVSHAAKLLGFAQANQLNSLIKTKHPDLLEARTPVVGRKRSIIGKGRARRKNPS